MVSFNLSSAYACLALLNLTTLIETDENGDYPMVYIKSSNTADWNGKVDAAIPCFNQVSGNQGVIYGDMGSLHAAIDDDEAYGDKARMKQSLDNWLNNGAALVKIQQSGDHLRNHSSTLMNAEIVDRKFRWEAYNDQDSYNFRSSCYEDLPTGTCLSQGGKPIPKSAIFRNYEDFEIDLLVWLHHECDEYSAGGSQYVENMRAQVDSHSERQYKRKISSIWLQPSKDAGWPDQARRPGIQPARYCYEP
ncbi:hypothetical protein CJU90_4255 [Yarrowia sp. C11]|nr:hypothetical protein CJU90_4255 [Yarrowia sp. C11]